MKYKKVISICSKQLSQVREPSKYFPPLDDFMAILHFSHGNPASVLGVHPVNSLAKDMQVVRIYRPDAQKAFVVKDGRSFKMDRVYDGIFERRFNGSDKIDYEIRIQNHYGEEYIINDPYAYTPDNFSDYDMHLFRQGKHYKIYELMGAQPSVVNGSSGYTFSVWAPNAKQVSLVGEFGDINRSDDWDGRYLQMSRLSDTGIWQIFVPSVAENIKYKYQITSANNGVELKIDPYARFAELRPADASLTYGISKFEWNDSQWMTQRVRFDSDKEPMSIYEVHLGSWMRTLENKFLTYEDIAPKLIAYVKEQGYTHVELMPITEYPFDGSWGYQVTGYYAPTSRFGSPEDLRCFIDLMHQNGIGVILDFVPAHFPKNAEALARFDGTALYEHADPRQGENPGWGTYVFNYGRNEVRNFLIGSALYWADYFHIDGLRVDAVANMLYLDFCKDEGDWIPNKLGGSENLEAIAFLREMNQVLHKRAPGIVTIAEDSSAFPGVTQPVEDNGIGFDLKWSLGWMNDILEYMEKDPIHRSYHHGMLTFMIHYYLNEKYVLPLSHDEVVHLKKAIVEKMPGDKWQKFANSRLLYSFMFAHPGKKLLFQGNDIAMHNEWSEDRSIDWHLTQNPLNKGIQLLIEDLNDIYKSEEAMHKLDFVSDGFKWIDFSDVKRSIISFRRIARELEDEIIAVFNFTPVPHRDYDLVVPVEGVYREVFNSDLEVYGGSGLVNPGYHHANKMPLDSKETSISVSLPPLGAVFFKKE